MRDPWRVEDPPDAVRQAARNGLQRGAGKTYDANDPETLAPTMTIEQMTDDAEAVVRCLRETYHKRKIFLVGHSFGSVLGVRLAQRHPDWFYAYIGVGQIVDMKRSEAIGYPLALRQARAHGNREAERELLALAPYPGDKATVERIGIERKWSDYYGGLANGRTSFDFDSDAEKLSPAYSDADLRAAKRPDSRVASCRPIGCDACASIHSAARTARRRSRADTATGMRGLPDTAPISPGLGHPRAPVSSVACLRKRSRSTRRCAVPAADA